MNYLKRTVNPVSAVLVIAMFMSGSKEVWQTAVLGFFTALVCIFCIINNTVNIKNINRIYIYAFTGFFIPLILNMLFSYDASAALEASGRFMVFFIFLFLLTHLKQDLNESGLLNAIIIVCLINSVFIIYQHFAGLNTVGFLPNNPNYSGFLLNVGAFIALWGIKAKDITERYISWAVLASGAFAAYIINSRSCYLVFLLMLMYFLHKKYGLKTILIFAAIFLLVFNFLPDKITKIGANSYGRFMIWAIALKSLFINPWTGVGLGSFGTAYELKKIPDYFNMLRYDHTDNFAHNDFLQIGVEMGVPMMAAAAVVFAIALFKLSALSFKGREAGCNLIVLFILCAAVVYMMFNFFIYHTFLLLFLALPFSVVLREAVSER